MKFSVDNVQLLSTLAVWVFLSTCDAAKVPGLNKRLANSTISSTSSVAAKNGPAADVQPSSRSSAGTSPVTISSIEATSTSSSSSSSLITPSATLFSSTATTNASSTITSAPPWGNQSIPINTCSVVDSDFNTAWTPCHIFAGTVQLSYFPQNSGNVSYPKTYYDPTLSVTLTSPSVYMVVNTITGSNDCGPLGPTYSTQVIPMDLSDVYTLQPYANSATTNRIGPPVQLTLSDLDDCPNYKDISTTGQIPATHPVDDTYNRCNPRLVFPVQLKRLGYPYWKHCGNAFYNFGIFDPPGAVPTADSLFVSTSAAAIVQTTESASPAPTPAQDQAASTTPAQQEATPTSVATQQAVGTASANVGSGSGSSAGSPGVVDSAPATSAGGVFAQTSTQPSVVAVVGTNTISAVAGSSGVILPNGSTASVGSVATLTDANGSEAVVSVATSGVFVAGSDSSSTFYANPTVANQVDASTSTAIATIAGQVISAAPGDSTVIINGQAITSGGQAVTLAGTNNVASVGSEGLIVQYPSGSVSTYAIPKSTPAAAGLSAAKTSSSLAKAGSSASVSTSSHGVANAIATSATTAGSSSQAAKASGSSNSSTSIAAAPSQFTGSGERIRGGPLALCMSLLLGLASWI